VRAEDNAAVDCLVSARKSILEEAAPGDWLALTAIHLIDCAADVVALLPERDIESAQEALGAARAAVTTATMAVRDIHDSAAGHDLTKEADHDHGRTEAHAKRRNSSAE